MKLLLLDNVEKVGKVGDLIEVKGGYARNYLIPMRLAVVATSGQIKFYQEKLDKMRKKLDEEMAVLKVVSDKVNGLELEIFKKATDDGRLFGSVSQKDIKSLLKEKVDDLDLEKIKISLDKVEKKIGIFPVLLKFGYDLQAECKINIKRKEK